MERKRIKGADFVRTVSAIGIVTHHFACNIANKGRGETLPLYNFANGNWGGLLVTVFFILSGAMLYYNNSEIKSLKTFYFKRWKSLFPMFYIAYIVFAIPIIFEESSLFYNGNPLSYILTLIGMDGYLDYKFTTYYILGEWFLGAIILLYLLYPLLLKAIKKPVIASLIFIALYIWQVYTNVFEISSMWNPISCGISFWFGMLFMKYYELIEKKKWIVTGVSLVGLLVMLFIKIPLDTNITLHLTGAFMFVALLLVGNVIMDNTSNVTNIITKVSSLSYAIFLVHHTLIYKILAGFKNLSPRKTLIMWVACMAIIMLVAYGLDYVNNRIIKNVHKPNRYHI